MDYDMSTREGRHAHLLDLLNDRAANLSLTEGLAHIYHATMYEFYVFRRDANKRKIKKHVKWLNDTEDVYRLRQDIHHW